MSAAIQQELLRLIYERPRSGGNLTRALMGSGFVPKADMGSYVVVKEALDALVAQGKVAKSGNGKSHHYRIAEGLSGR